MTKQIKQTAKAGFTLVELAIVLVIIGLIVGGILAGQDMIKAAEIRASMADLESYNLGASTFRSKYGGLPGDLLATRASQYGFQTRTGAAGHGDGNGLVEGCAIGATALGCETALFWRDLSAARLVPDDFSTGTDAAAATITGASVNSYLPDMPIRGTSYVHVFPLSGRNYFYLGGLTTGAGGAVLSAAGLTPNEAAQIDEKADDGLPTTGIIRAVTGFVTTSVGLDAGAASATGVCVNTDLTPDQYNNATETFQGEINCRVYYRASF